VVLSVPSDVDRLAPRLREADRLEVEAASGLSPLEALRHGYEHSEDPRTVMLANDPIALFGVVPFPYPQYDWGVPWMLGSDAVLEHWFGFARGSVREFEILRRPYSVLTNHVDPRNELAVRWLRWLGFDLLETAPYGVAGLAFTRFEWRRSATRT